MMLSTLFSGMLETARANFARTQFYNNCVYLKVLRRLVYEVQQYCTFDPGYKQQTV